MSDRETQAATRPRERELGTSLAEVHDSSLQYRDPDRKFSTVTRRSLPHEIRR
jgi:hypothetical protein